MKGEAAQRRRVCLFIVCWVAALAALGIALAQSVLSTTSSALASSGAATAGSSRKAVTLRLVGGIPLYPGRAGGSIPALTHPVCVRPEEAGAWLKSDARVIGVQVGREFRAYPVNILNYHEIVNDRVGGREIAVTWCPLAGAAAGFDREFEGRQLAFSVADVVFESTLVMVDRPTGSLWYQLRGEAIQGRHKGKRLSRVPVTACTWSYWLSNHPNTLVLSYKTGYTTNYAANYWRNRYAMGTNLYSPPGFPVMWLDGTRPPKEWVVGLEAGEKRIALPLAELLSGPVRLNLDGQMVRTEFNRDGQCVETFWETSAGHSPGRATTCYWFAWKAAHWTSEVWEAPARVALTTRQ